MDLRAKKVTVELVDLDSSEPLKPVVYEADDFHLRIVEERGLCATYNIHGEATDHHSNGQRRLTIHLWKGCEKYEDYQERTEEEVI